MKTGQVQVDPDKIWAESEGQSLDLHIALEGLKTGRGQLSVRLETIDESKRLQAKTVSFNAVEGETSDVVVTLPLPDGADTREELVDFNVRITGTGENSALSVRKSLLYTLDAYELRVQGPARVTQDKEVAYRLLAQHPLTHEPAAGRDISVTLDSEDGDAQTFDVETDAEGTAQVKVSAAEAGNYSLSATASAGIAPIEVTDEVEAVSNGHKLLLTTDKPLYKPGQTIHLRALALDRGKNEPIAETDAVFEVEDGKGNKIFRKTIATSEFGIAATTFKIGSIVNEGTFKLRVITGEVMTEKTVEVSQYALPKFRLGLTTDKPWYGAGETLSGVVDAEYFFGKTVSGGTIDVEAYALDIGPNMFAHVMGKTNAEGRYEFSVELPSLLVGLPLEQGLAVVTLKITATDTAGQQVVKEETVFVAPQPLRIALVPEATDLVPGIENRLALFVTDPLGTPVDNAEVTLTPAGGDAIDVTTNSQGFAAVKYTPADASSVITADVTAGDVEVTESFTFLLQAAAEHVLVRTDKSVYDVGETVTVNVLTDDTSGSVFIDWLNDGQTVDVRTLEPEDGAATFSMTIDETLLGANRVEAYIVGEDGNIVRAGRNVFARGASALDVKITPDKAQYAPGEPAAITFDVKDEAGKPTVAALGVQIVDEAVFALTDARPGLLKTYFQLEDEFAVPHYQLRAPSADLSELLFAHPESDADQKAAQEKSAAVLAALGSSPMMGLDAGSWADVVRESNPRLTPFFDTLKKTLVTDLSARAKAALTALVDAGCDLEQYWCDALEMDLYSAFQDQVKKDYKPYDFWGNAFEVSSSFNVFLTLKSAGPDEQSGTADDQSIAVDASDLKLTDLPSKVDRGGILVQDGGVAPPDFNAPNAGGDFGPGQAAGGAAAGGEPPVDDDTSSDGEPRVRKDFPETLYDNPAVITDPDGTATITLDMADSITEWRLSALANSRNGKLGSNTAGITVFQDFFVDVDFPATLTRGDEVEFPIAVYNYLDEPQTVSIELEAADWYTALGETAASIELAAGEVKGVSFPVRVDQVGLRTLTVRGIGSEKSDAVARAVRVVPDGKAFPTVNSGSLAGTVDHTLSFPDGRVAGSELLYLNVFPNFLSQAVQGTESMLQVPNGCFEQTTSTAWPNVLVTRYLKQTGQDTPEILLRAESLMSAGYQRLLTFEHAGGGFSWFGEQDPAPFLSVTAFGVMEFSDMAKVHPVDEAMIARTVAWLVGEQSSDGSWEGDQSEFFSFHTSKLRNTAFVLWALASAGYEGPETESGLAYVAGQLDTESVDAYTLGLIANAFALLSPSDPTLSTVIDRLLTMATETDGDVPTVAWDTGGTQTNFFAGGDDAAVTATALVTHALLTVGGYPDLIAKGLNYLTAHKDPQGNFGSTQATIWTLRTLILAAEKGTEPAIGTLSVEVDGEPFGMVDLTDEQAGVMTTVDMSTLATTGDHTVTLSFAGEGKPSYSLVGSYNLPWVDAPADPEGPLSVSVAYDRTQLTVNETAEATVTVVNNTDGVQNMTLVTVGIPPGFEVQTDDFSQYLDAGTLSRFELTGKQLIFYITQLEASATLELVYHLRATLPVKASDGGSSVYPYYEPNKKSEAPATDLEVAAE